MTSKTDYEINPKHFTVSVCVANLIVENLIKYSTPCNFWIQRFEIETDHVWEGICISVLKNIPAKVLSKNTFYVQSSSRREALSQAVTRM